MSERTVEFYRKENGRIPVEEFLDELPMKHREKAKKYKEDYMRRMENE